MRGLSGRIVQPLYRVLLVCLLLAACHTMTPEAVKLPSLAQAYQGRIRIGAAIEPWQLDRPEHALIATQFNSIVAENAMKPSRLQPREGHFDFAEADRLVDFALQYGMAIRGHTLLWYKRTPAWFWLAADGKPADKAQVLARLRQHIEQVIGRYRGKIYAWDVVNEAIDPNQPNCLRNDAWYQVVGPEYLDAAFRYAHAADPAARLFLNDYSTTQPRKRQCLAQIVSGMLKRGVPLHGIGHQMHISLDEPGLPEIDETLSTFSRMGLENQITELDISLYPRHAYFLPDSLDVLEARQAARYQALMTLVLAHPDVSAVTWWGVSDGHTWLNEYENWWRRDRPLLFDAQGRAKSSYWAVLRAIREVSNR